MVTQHDPDQRSHRHPARYHAWNTLGALAMTTGRSLYRAGLTLCGWAGWLDATADQHR